MKPVEVVQSNQSNEPWNLALGKVSRRMKYPDDVVEVCVLGHLELQVRFFDGTTGVVKFLPAHLTSVFSRLNDPEFFKQVTCKDGYVSWPGEIDLAPDAMHQIFQDKDVWIVPALKQI